MRDDLQGDAVRRTRFSCESACVHVREIYLRP
jgi:hypothetical protein